MPDSEFESLLLRTLRQRESEGLLRSLRVVAPPADLEAQPATVRRDGRELINFASNDYLGLCRHPRVVEALRGAALTHGAGAGAAPLITGHTDLHHRAAAMLALLKRTQEAVILPSGYQANHAIIQTLAAVAPGGKVRFLLDKLAHASLIDAVQGSGKPYRIFPHNNLAKLERLLVEAAGDELQVVVTESIFSMDGDAADLQGLAAVKARRPFVLVVDEAHATGVYGPAGAGLAAEVGCSDAVDVTLVTLGKALGCGGAAICGSRAFCGAVANFGRAFVYSTGVPACVLAGVCAALDVCRDEPHRAARVRQAASRVRAALSQRYEIPPGDSPIIPLIVGDEQAALGLSERLLAAGMLCVAIRPPTVARGASRIRVTLSSAHTDSEIDRLIDGLMSPVDPRLV